MWVLFRQTMQTVAPNPVVSEESGAIATSARRSAAWRAALATQLSNNARGLAG
jgi:hypothetical protein